MSQFTNRLINETSPYLLQHAHNPVDWRPWGIEAIEQAKKEDKPIYLSIGYSTCYWCHKMEKDCFENQQAAKLLNEFFISIKVDREELPDIDEQYMLATQLITGRGGWPNSVWLTPDGKPFMAGSYYPLEQFTELLTNIKDAWKTHRKEVEQQAQQLTAKMRQISGGAELPKAVPVNQQLIDKGIEQISQSFDDVYGGFGGVPKFPPHNSLSLLIQQYRQAGDKNLLAMIIKTLDAMAAGGIYDHIGGGFHRYSTDYRWFVPHFEKMLYDNAQLMRIYAQAYQLTGNENYKAVVESIFGWLISEMTDANGGFYSAIDAGEVGKEGEFYLWRYDEVIDALGQKDGTQFAKIYNIEKEGNYGLEKATNILNLPRAIEPYSLRKMCTKLLAVRDKRPHPHKDDKIIAGINGLMIEGLIYAGRIFNEPKYYQAAVKAADFILNNMTAGNHLKHTFRAGLAKTPGYLDDYVFFATSLLDLYEQDGIPRWLEAAKGFAEVILQEFADTANGGFYYASAEHQPVLIRSKHLMGGGNIPSPNGIAAIMLLRLWRITNESRYAQAAHHTLDAFSGLIAQMPQSFETEILAAAISIEPVHAL